MHSTPERERSGVGVDTATLRISYPRPHGRHLIEVFVRADVTTHQLERKNLTGVRGVTIDGPEVGRLNIVMQCENDQ
jgi:hypothetical protein